MIFQPVSNLKQAMQARKLRNSCCEYLTNHRLPISVHSQFIWYLRSYRRASNSGEYRLYLAFDRKIAVGYGALSLEAEGLQVTECVASDHRGRGYGSAILDHLIQIAKQEERNLIAEIWSSNKRSIVMHERVGFQLESSRSKDGKEIRRYLLALQADASRTAEQEHRSRVVA
jgi:RimJ/RimL family protein N-acetyltransferase